MDYLPCAPPRYEASAGYFSHHVLLPESPTEMWPSHPGQYSIPAAGPGNPGRPDCWQHCPPRRSSVRAVSKKCCRLRSNTEIILPDPFRPGHCAFPFSILRQPLQRLRQYAHCYFLFSIKMPLQMQGKTCSHH